VKHFLSLGGGGGISDSKDRVKKSGKLFVFLSTFNMSTFF